MIPTADADKDSANVDSVREVWRGHIVSPFTASPDGIFQVALDADKNVGYHIPGNITVTSQAFNFFLDRFPPICLPLTEKARLAESRKDLDEVSKAFCNLVTTMNSIPKKKKARSRLVLSEQQMAELHNALRTAQPGPEPRRYYRWHAPGDGPGIGRTHHLRTCQEVYIIYQYTQLHNIRALPKYRPVIQDDPEFCFKEGVFFPFSASAPIEYWYEHNNQSFFAYQLATKDRVCDRATKYHHKTNASLMMFQTYRNCLDRALKNGRKRDGTWTIQDELGLEPWPLLDMPWTASVGHIIHGEPMITGYPPGVAYPENQEEYDEKRNNMTWESWAWNHEKQSMGDEPELLQKMLLRHRNLRPAIEVKRFWEMEDNVRVDADYISKITNARKQWGTLERQKSSKDLHAEEPKDPKTTEMVQNAWKEALAAYEQKSENSREVGHQSGNNSDIQRADSDDDGDGDGDGDDDGDGDGDGDDDDDDEDDDDDGDGDGEGDGEDDDDWSIIETTTAEAQEDAENSEDQGQANDVMLEQHRKEIDGIYRCLDTIRTKASPALVEIFRPAVRLKRKRSKNNDNSSKRHHISSQADDARPVSQLPGSQLSIRVKEKKRDEWRFITFQRYGPPSSRSASPYSAFSNSEAARFASQRTAQPKDTQQRVLPVTIEEVEDDGT